MSLMASVAPKVEEISIQNTSKRMDSGISGIAVPLEWRSVRASENFGRDLPYVT